MKEKVRIYIVEDRAITRMTIEDVLVKAGYEIVGSSVKAEQAWEAICSNEIDLVILDINLVGDKDGIWIATQIRENLNIPFIFLTAFGDSKTLGKVMETSPNGYLMKPFKNADILSSVAIALQNFASGKKAAMEKKPKAEPGNVMALKDCIFVKDDYAFVKLRVDEIRYLKSDNNYVEIYVKEKMKLVRCKLKEVQEFLPADKFVQIHRSHVVNIEKIEKFGSGFVIMGADRLPVSSSHKDKLMAKFTMLK
jgi:DNA-binding LytR/AlgR family response regulator